MVDLKDFKSVQEMMKKRMDDAAKEKLSKLIESPSLDESDDELDEDVGRKLDEAKMIRDMNDSEKKKLKDKLVKYGVKGGGNAKDEEKFVSRNFDTILNAFGSYEGLPSKIYQIMQSIDGVDGVER